VKEVALARRLAAAAAAVAALAAAGCAPPSLAYRAHLSTLVEERKYPDAAAWIEEARETKYGSRDRVLYWLDKGAILHQARDYRGSDGLLDQAELRMEELYTKSLSQAVGTVLVNDATQDYAGEPHERALLYVFRALNYAYAQKVDDAVVEARKVTAFLEQQGERVGLKTYRDDGFAHYLCALLFEDQGRLDDARISRAAAERAYGRYEQAYRTRAPRFGLAPRRAGDGELVVLHYNGKIPLRESKRTSVPVGRKRTVREMAAAGSDEDSAEMAIAIPAIVEQPYAIRSSSVRVGALLARSVVVEPIAAIATKTLEDELPAMKARAASRAVAKGGAYGAAEGAASTSKLASILAGAGLGAANAMEEADTRAWSTLPAEIRMARIVLPEGVHDVSVEYADAQGQPIGSERLGRVEIVRGFRTYVHVRTAR
jgi:uncharacterized protein